MKVKLIGLVVSYFIGLHTLLAEENPLQTSFNRPLPKQALSTFKVNYGGRGFEAANDIVNVSSGGFLVAGRTATSSGGTDMYLLRLNDQGQLEWEQKIGENESDEASEILELENGDFIIVGNSDSYGAKPGLNDMWAVRIDGEGNEIWNKTYDAENSIGEASGIVPAHGGGYLIVGHTLSLENEASDIVLVKISDSGEKEWEKRYGGEKSEESTDIVKVEEGYTVVGHTESKGRGKWDIWMLHVDQEGNEMWDKTFGGGDNEMGNSIIQTSDGGYVIGGYTYSFAVASLDAWIVKTDKNGEQQWSKAFGSYSTDEAFEVIETKDGNFVMAGYTQVYIPDENGNNTSNEGYNVFLVKVSAEGKEIWQSSIGGEHEQRAFGIVETEDEGLVAVGLENKLDSNGYDVLIVKVSKSGS